MNINTSNKASATLQIINMESVSFKCNDFAIPAINLPNVEIHSPLSTIPLHGDKCSFDNLDITYLVDDDLSNWKVLYNTMIKTGYPFSYQDRNHCKIPDETDVYLHIYNNTNKYLFSVRFHHVVLVSMGAISFNTTDSNVTQMTSTASFSYSYYTIEQGENNNANEC